MAKPKTPLLSLGARGTIADSLTFQKRGRGTIVRQKPIPKDPKSPAQLAWRQVYRDAVAAWHALTAEGKEAWRGVCPGLTAYQCFMSSELKYAPPLEIDIGSEAIDRTLYHGFDWTILEMNNPANASGKITSVEIWAVSNEGLTDCKVGTFYRLGNSDYKCRDSANIGTVTSGSKQIFSGLDIAVETGDCIGIYFSRGEIERDLGGETFYRVAGDHVNPGDQATFSAAVPGYFSLYGIGEQAT
ncbi:hypothetical protein ES705_40314 [subsurface metagenome]